ncbi:hypothetical protein C7H19_01430 [Aphanothece hegewaldii CCALA 016]|uniref:Uncharacterized protein n=1 Tax=Aphanothece hegewaldii CCALA 016 TaxID=2107694 RepID=A0A2T1M3T9_9CHRO|nr:hypothetical protein [Aphanothece hegewaldii]PSF39476.1 hypothetical protein C7H19_01430 [Aphanothece hegewaldii CCALA 016]
MNLLMDVAANPNAPEYSVSLLLVMVIGFVAAAGIGSIAWYNSKRPLGWEDKERPEIVPDVPKVDLDQ